MPTHIFLFVFISLSISLVVVAYVSGSVNLTDFVRHRQKRFLIWENGGVLKLSTGANLPLDLADPITWRSVTISYNLQGGQYNMPATAIYPWDKWEHIFARSMRKMTDHLQRHGKYQQDDSRLFVYALLESYMNRQSGNGRACLLRSICENAQVDQYMGIFAEVLNIVLTPGMETLHSIYKQALEAGKSGADCLQLYYQCPRGVSLLDQFLHEF